MDQDILMETHKQQVTRQWQPILLILIRQLLEELQHFIKLYLEGNQV